MPDRIAIVTTSYPTHPGDASGHFVAAEARALAAAGHRVTVITGGTQPPRAGCPEIVRLADGGATGWPGLVPRLSQDRLRWLGLARWVLSARRELGRRGPFDRVVAHWMLPAACPVALLAELRGARLDVVVHGSDARLLARLPAGLGRGVVGALSRRGARFRCVSPELARIVEQLGGAARHPIRVEASPIELGAPRTRRSARAALGVPDATRLIVIAGRMIPEKRTSVALAAASLVAGAEIVALGDGPELEPLRAAFPRVRFCGRLDRAAALDWIAAADVVLSASRDEGSPSVVREARALGVPVVAVSAGDLPSAAVHDSGLFLVR